MINIRRLNRPRKRPRADPTVAKGKLGRMFSAKRRGIHRKLGAVPPRFMVPETLALNTCHADSFSHGPIARSILDKLIEPVKLEE